MSNKKSKENNIGKIEKTFSQYVTNVYNQINTLNLINYFKKNELSIEDIK